MTDKEIYKRWLSEFKDRRYLRPKRWETLKKALLDHKVSSVIEFGSGVSTLLMENLGIDILSLETDKKHILFVRKFSSGAAKFRPWKNEPHLNIARRFDLAFVDGILPREHQIEVAKRCTDLIAIDDFAGRAVNLALPHLEGFKRIDSKDTILAVFNRQEIR